MNWSCEQVITWCKLFIDDDSILSRFKGQFVLIYYAKACVVLSNESSFCVCVNE